MARGPSPVILGWYDGGGVPGLLAERKISGWESGVLFVGTRGLLVADYDRLALLPEAEFRDHEAPEPTIPDSPGHHAEWIAACKTGSPTTCNFDDSGALTEAVLLGNVAYRAGRTLR